MPTMTTQRSIARNIVLSSNAQLTWGEVMADAMLTYRMRPETSGFAKQTYEKETDYQYAGKGNSFATESRLIAEQSACDISARLDAFLAGWSLAFVMGQEQFTAGEAGAPNTHLFTWKDTADPAPATNLYIEDTVALKRKWSDMALSQLVLSGSDKGSISAKMSFIGTDVVTDGAMAEIPALATESYLYGSASTVSIGPVGAPVSMSPRVASWEATFDHQCDPMRSVGCGTKPNFIRLGLPINKLKLVILVDTSSDVRGWMINQTPLEISIAVANGTNSLTIDYPNVIPPSADLSEQNKYVAYTLDLDQNSILEGGAGQSVTATVLNTYPQYLVAA